MRVFHVLVLLSALVLGTTAAASPQYPTRGSTTDTGPNGAKNGCYEGGKKLKVTGKTTGDQEVVVTDRDGNTDSGLGTPAADGGVWESEEMTVGGEKVKVDKGKLKRQRANGSWETLAQVDDKQCEDGTAGPGAPGRGGDGTHGTLPDDPWTASYSYVPSWDEQLELNTDPLRDSCKIPGVG